MGTLSVRENLYFSAALRLPNSISWSEKRRRVQKIIEDLGLTACCDTKVSDTIECYTIERENLVVVLFWRFTRRLSKCIAYGLDRQNLW